MQACARALSQRDSMRAMASTMAAWLMPCSSRMASSGEGALSACLPVRPDSCKAQLLELELELEPELELGCIASCLS